MHSNQWQSYFLCQGQSPVYFRQDERERLDWWTVHRQKRSLLLLLLLLSPWIASFSESVDSEFILRDFTCSVSPALPAGTITSLSDYNLPPTVLPVHLKKRKRKHFLEPQAGMSHVLPSTPHLHLHFHLPTTSQAEVFLPHLLGSVGLGGGVIVRFSPARCSAGDS